MTDTTAESNLEGRSIHASSDSTGTVCIRLKVDPWMREPHRYVDTSTGREKPQPTAGAHRARGSVDD